MNNFKLKKEFFAALTHAPIDNPIVSIDKPWSETTKHISFNFKAIIEDYFGTVTLSDEEVDFLEREHIRTMNKINELLSPSIANLHIFEACNLEPGSFWIIGNASIFDKIRAVKNCKPNAHKLFDGLCQYKIFLERPDFIRRMNPINSLKKWLLNILVPYIEGTHKQKGKDKQWIIF